MYSKVSDSTDTYIKLNCYTWAYMYVNFGSQVCTQCIEITCMYIDVCVRLLEQFHIDENANKLQVFMLNIEKIVLQSQIVKAVRLFLGMKIQMSKQWFEILLDNDNFEFYFILFYEY